MRTKPDASSEMRAFGVFLSTVRNRVHPNVGAAILSVRMGFSSTYLGMIDRGLKLPSEEATEIIMKEFRMTPADRLRCLRLLARAKVASSLSSSLRKIFEEDVVARGDVGPGVPDEDHSELREDVLEMHRKLTDTLERLGLSAPSKRR